MTRKERPSKNVVVAFKVEEELADMLNKLPNKSAFIRRAIAAQFGKVCPLCQGKGIVPRGVHDHIAPQLKEMHHSQCEGCGEETKVPMDAGQLTEEEHDRLEQFLLGGPLYCDNCYDKAPTCTDCGMHIDTQHFAEHHRQAHRD